MRYFFPLLAEKFSLSGCMTREDYLAKKSDLLDGISIDYLGLRNGRKA
jgi:hypothetical protein